MSHNTEPSINRPTHQAFHVVERDGNDAIWNRIGSGGRTVTTKASTSSFK